MSLWSLIFGEKDDLKPVERPSVMEPPSAELIPEAFEIQVPWLPASLLSILESRAAAEPLVAWKVKPGTAVQARAIIAEFRLNWTGIETGNVYPHRKNEILTGSVEMPFNGIVRFGSTDKSDKCFCSLQPLLDEENTFLYKRRYRGTEKADHENWLSYLVSPHGFYFPACEAIWLILDHQADSTGEHGDPNDLINREIKTIRTTVLERDTGV